MQAGEKGMDIDSSKIQINGPSPHYKNYNSEGEISRNSHEFHEKSGHKPAGNTLHQDHVEDQEPLVGDKPVHEHNGEREYQNHKQYEEMKIGQHKENKHSAHEQHEEVKHQGHEQHEEIKHEQHEGMKHEGHGLSRGKDHGDHHAHMLADFRKRFLVSSILTFPVLLFSPTIQSFFGFELRFPVADSLTLLFSSAVYFYGGYPFIKGIKEELSEKSPGMMTLIAIAISVAYFYSSAVVFWLQGEVFSGNW